MWTLRTAYFLIILTMVASQRRFYRRTNDRFPDVQESTLSQKEVMDTTTPVINVKSRLLPSLQELSQETDLKRSSRDIVSSLVDIGLTNWEAIKAAKLILLNTLASEIATLIEEVKNADITDLLESPYINRLVNLLSSLLSNSASLQNSKMVTDAINIDDVGTETATIREYSSSDSTSSMQDASSSTTSFSLPHGSSL
ncbi:uncharacterized protein LOC105662159 [Megachile rotundata]|uniref:uncharacterized protein LOC105662159 n=1 Tax=Megachile rotundata TaxID=143995 RepID=UPI000615343A|nr:PREDICTED: uncharacterized protein LOC105662159 [Megachile rotundata]